MIKLKMVVCCVLLVSFSAVSNIKNSTFEYVMITKLDGNTTDTDMFGDVHLSDIVVKLKGNGLGKIEMSHIGVSFQVDELKNYVSIPAPFSFVLPKDIQFIIGKTWTVDGMIFEITGKREMSIFGRHYSTFLIAHRFEKCDNSYVKRTFFYSEKHGVVGFIAKSNESNEFWFSKSQTGILLSDLLR